MSNPKPHRGRKVCAYAKCYDAKGRIIEGARVYFYWPKAGGGTVKVTAYTNQYGVAHSWRSTSGLAIKKHRVKSVSDSSGASRTTSVRVQGPALESGRRSPIHVRSILIGCATGVA